MYKIIDKYIADKNRSALLEQCAKENQNHLGALLIEIIKSISSTPRNKLKKDNVTVTNSIDVVNDNPPLMDPPILIKLLCNWTTSEILRETWNRMSKGNYSWNNITVVLEEPVDYYVVINMPPKGINPDKSKTILFRMEPHMENHPEIWGEWANPDRSEFKFAGFHDTHFNNNEWHLTPGYNDFMTRPIAKNHLLDGVLSTVLSDKYWDPGHVKRIDFIKMLEKSNLPVHVFGGNKFEWKDYKGPLPDHAKDAAMFPYKYTFNAENQSINGYYTEKLIDGILAENLVFYNGCPNIADYIDERAFVWLDLIDMEADCKKVQDAIANNLWEERLPFIREAKQKILNETQFFPRLEKILKKK